MRNSDCLVIVQSSHVLQRPWCLLEVYEAVRLGIPLLTVNIEGTRGVERMASLTGHW